MRALLASVAVILAASCGPSADRQQAGGEAAAGAATEERVECAISGSERFEPVCSVERSAGDQGMVLTIRDPGGGFRRLLVTGDGRGVVAADGAERALVRPLGADLIEVSVGNDRYRLPATVSAPAS